MSGMNRTPRPGATIRSRSDGVRFAVGASGDAVLELLRDDLTGEAMPPYASRRARMLLLLPVLVLVAGASAAHADPRSDRKAWELHGTRAFNAPPPTAETGSPEDAARAAAIVARWLDISTVEPTPWESSPRFAEGAEGSSWNDLVHEQPWQMARIAETAQLERLKAELRAYHYLTVNEERDARFKLDRDATRIAEVNVKGLERTFRGEMLAMRAPHAFTARTADRLRNMREHRDNLRRELNGYLSAAQMARFERRLDLLLARLDGPEGELRILPGDPPAAPPERMPAAPALHAVPAEVPATLVPVPPEAPPPAAQALLTPVPVPSPPAPREEQPPREPAATVAPQASLFAVTPGVSSTPGWSGTLFPGVAAPTTPQPAPGLPAGPVTLAPGRYLPDW
jgi:hypothetical protein